jgi:hypothetical protein
MLDKLDRYSITHIPREANVTANALAQQASGYEVKKGRFKVRRRPTSESMMLIEDCVENQEREIWRRELIEYISHPEDGQGRKVWRQVLSYTVINGEIYRRTVGGLLLRCLNEDEAKIAMGEVHEVMCGMHQSITKMRWALKRADMYWPGMLKDYFQYFKGCEWCQIFGKI